jgi:hypothetical protein
MLSMLQVRVGIDASGDDDQARGVEHARGVGRQGAWLGHGGDRLAADADVAYTHAIGRDHLTVAHDEIEHAPRLAERLAAVNGGVALTPAPCLPD